MKRRSQRHCYMCSRPATSKQHVPPKCFFPSYKDRPVGPDYRSNLATVPSCDQHNLAQAENEEYVRMVIASQYFTNPVGPDVARGPVSRAIREKPSLLRLLIPWQTELSVAGQETIATGVDWLRFDLTIQCIARGLYYLEYKAKWLDKAYVVAPRFIAADQPEAQELIARVEYEVHRFLAGQPLLGTHPDVFSYQVVREADNVVLSMYFYEYFPAVVFSSPTIADLMPDQPSNDMT